MPLFNTNGALAERLTLWTEISPIVACRALIVVGEVSLGALARVVGGVRGGVKMLSSVASSASFLVGALLAAVLDWWAGDALVLRVDVLCLVGTGFTFGRVETWPASSPTNLTIASHIVVPLVVVTNPVLIGYFGRTNDQNSITIIRQC